MRVVSLNANGIRAASRKGFFEWMQQCNPDVVCIQETKAHECQLDETFFPPGYHCQYVDAEKKGYSGVAIYSKVKPEQIGVKLDYPLFDSEGRYVRFDYQNCSIISLYLPSGTSGDERQTLKYQAMAFLEAHMLALQSSKRPFIICGDWNIAHTKKDIKNWRGNQKNSGFLPEERAWLDKLFGSLGFIDGFRVVNQEDEQYTWWSNRGQAWANNTGWRIDYQVLSPELAEKVATASIYKAQRFSDHAPLVIDFKDITL